MKTPPQLPRSLAHTAAFIAANWRSIAITLVVVTGLAVALWLAGFIFFALAHHNPLHAGLWGWVAGLLDYWNGDLPNQGKHLAVAALVGLALAFGAPLGAYAAIQNQRNQRELHGSARFATEAEIRKAGLL